MATCDEAGDDSNDSDERGTGSRVAAAVGGAVLTAVALARVVEEAAADERLVVANMSSIAATAANAARADIAAKNEWQRRGCCQTATHIGNAHITSRPSLYSTDHR